MNRAKFTLIVCGMFMFLTAIFYSPKWEQSRTEATLSWDVSGYYMYLPAIFIYKDLRKLTFQDQVIRDYYPTPAFQQAFLHEPSGNYVMKYSCGQAILMLPFFLIAHIFALVSSAYPADGFSYPYQIGIGLGMLTYTFLGLILINRILLHFFSKNTTAIVLFTLVFGTNYLNYAIIDQAMTHSTLFTIYAAIVYLTVIFYQKPKLNIAIGIGALIGLATLIRPSEIIAWLIPILWGINNREEFRKRIADIPGYIKYFLAAILSFCVVASIQSIYWKYASGDWLVYSYQDQGFSWRHPHVYQFAFSYCCGWLRYSPVLILAVVGIIPFIFTGKNRIAILFFLAINYYVVSAWDIWDYGGMSGRAMIQSYPILMFPFAYLVQLIHERKYWKFILYPLIALGIYLNLWWTHNAHRGTVPVFTYATKEYYWHVVGRWSINKKLLALLDNKYLYTGEPANSTLLYTNSFENDSTANAIDSGIHGRSIELSSTLQYTAEYPITSTNCNGNWIRASADFRCKAKEWDVWRQAQFIMKLYYRDSHRLTSFIRVYRFLNDNDTQRLSLDINTRDMYWDKIVITFWNAESDKPLQIDNLTIECFD